MVLVPRAPLQSKIPRSSWNDISCFRAAREPTGMSDRPWIIRLRGSESFTSSVSEPFAGLHLYTGQLSVKSKTPAQMSLIADAQAKA